MQHELAGVRTGRASVTILDSVHVEAYGSKMPLNQLAGLSVPEPTLIVAQPFDPSQLGAIEKAIRAVGPRPESRQRRQGRAHPAAALTEERRKELSRHVHKLSEEGRNSVRQVRRDANERLKKLLKDHKISEDDEKKGLDEVQKITDNHIKQSTICRRRRTRSCSASRSNLPSYDFNATDPRRSSEYVQIVDVLFTHLECSVPCGAPPLDPRERHHLCSCGAPLLARYDLDAARALVARHASPAAPPTMWRYRELLPLFDGEEPVTLGEGFTPLFHARRLGASLGLDALYIKDESLNPTNSFKARGQSAAITRARSTSARRRIALPTAGNAGNAAAAYAAARRPRLRRSSSRGRQAAVRRRMPRCTAPTSRWSTA